MLWVIPQWLRVLRNCHSRTHPSLIINDICLNVLIHAADHEMSEWVVYLTSLLNSQGLYEWRIRPCQGRAMKWRMTGPQSWIHWVSNPGPSGRKSSVLPLDQAHRREMKFRDSSIGCMWSEFSPMPLIGSKSHFILPVVNVQMEGLWIFWKKKLYSR